MSTAVIPDRGCFKCGKRATAARPSRLKPDTVSIRLCQDCLRLEMGCIDCGTTEPMDLSQGCERYWSCAMADEHQRERASREAAFSAPPCDLPEGLTLKDATVFSPYADRYAVVERYVDTTGRLMAKRHYDCSGSEERTVMEEKWFDAEGRLHRGGGPAHIKSAYYRMPWDMYLGEAFECWYTHGNLTHEADTTDG